MPSLLNDFAQGAFLVTQSDSADVTGNPVAIQATATGTLKVTTLEGDTFTMNVPFAGYITPFAVRRVFDTGTTVADADLIALRIR